MEPPDPDTPSHLLDHDTTLHDDLRAPHTPRKRALSQAHRYHNFRAPALSPGLVSQPYLHTPPLLHPNTYLWRATANLTLDALIAHPETTIRTWTKKDMYLESLKPEFYWPKRPPHHYGRCRGCHNYWPHNKKGRRTMGRLRRERMDEGVREWREGWGVGDDGRVCEVCEEEGYWYYGEAVGWGSDGRPVILRGIDTEGLGGGGENGGGEGVSDDEKEWDMLDSGSDSRSSTCGGWEVLDRDEF
jgi:hypothetical protein